MAQPYSFQFTDIPGARCLHFFQSSVSASTPSTGPWLWEEGEEVPLPSSLLSRGHLECTTLWLQQRGNGAEGGLATRRALEDAGAHSGVDSDKSSDGPELPSLLFKMQAVHLCINLTRSQLRCNESVEVGEAGN